MEKIKHFEQTGAEILQLDITDSQQNIRDTVAKAASFYGRIDVLVNNAAYIAIGTWEDLEQDLDVHCECGTLAYVMADRRIFKHSLIPTSSGRSR